jgi:hypothetical protein
MTTQRFGTTPPDDPHRYNFVLTRDDVAMVLRYTHVYPNLHGYTRKFFEKNYPGYSLQIFMEIFTAAGILTKKGTGTPGGRCKDRLHTIYFNSRSSFYVQWDNSPLSSDESETGESQTREE